VRVVDWGGAARKRLPWKTAGQWPLLESLEPSSSGDFNLGYLRTSCCFSSRGVHPRYSRKSHATNPCIEREKAPKERGAERQLEIAYGHLSPIGADIDSVERALAPDMRMANVISDTDSDDGAIHTSRKGRIGAAMDFEERE
jgi:hypothetical protein